MRLVTQTCFMKPEPGLTLPVLFEHQLPLLRLVLVLSTSPVFTSFTCKHRPNVLSADGLETGKSSGIYCILKRETENGSEL